MFRYRYTRIYELFTKIGSYYNFPFSLTISYGQLYRLAYIALKHSYNGYIIFH